jgi:hypothetical protein
MAGTRSVSSSITRAMLDSSARNETPVSNNNSKNTLAFFISWLAPIIDDNNG